MTYRGNITYSVLVMIVRHFKIVWSAIIVHNVYMKFSKQNGIIYYLYYIN